MAHKRPASAPQFTYGRTIAKAMDVFDLDPARWTELAADRGAWRAMLRSVRFYDFMKSEKWAVNFTAISLQFHFN